MNCRERNNKTLTFSNSITPTKNRRFNRRNNRSNFINLLRLKNLKKGKLNQEMMNLVIRWKSYLSKYNKKHIRLLRRTKIYDYNQKTNLYLGYYL